MKVTSRVAALALSLSVQQGVAQTTSPDIASIQAKITAERAAIRKAISVRDATVLRKYWSPVLIANAPTNTIVSRSQIVEAMEHGYLNYSVESTPEFFTVTSGTAILMSREEVVPFDGPMAGKHLVRRSTDIYQRSGEDWLLVASQATFVGFDSNPANDPGSAFTPPLATPETEAILAQIRANGAAVGHAIRTMDFAALEKNWSPALVVNSPGNRVLTRDQVFTAMREDKLKYTSYKVSPDAFFVTKDLAIQMGHEEIVMANGPMADQPLKRRYTDVWQKTGDTWLMIARQATYVGIDGAAAYDHHPDPNHKQ